MYDKWKASEVRCTELQKLKANYEKMQALLSNLGAFVNHKITAPGVEATLEPVEQSLIPDAEEPQAPQAISFDTNIEDHGNKEEDAGMAGANLFEEKQSGTAPKTKESLFDL